MTENLDFRQVWQIIVCKVMVQTVPIAPIQTAHIPQTTSKGRFNYYIYLNFKFLFLYLNTCSMQRHVKKTSHLSPASLQMPLNHKGLHPYIPYVLAICREEQMALWDYTYRAY